MSTPAFLDHPSEMAGRIAAHDWPRTGLGPIAAWPPGLRTVIGFMVRSPLPMVLLWGADGVMVYNDAYSTFAGRRHPALLGSEVREGWPEVADFNDHVLDVVLGGGTLSYRDQELTLERSGHPEPAWMNLDYSPVLDEDGRPAGVIAMVVETTERVRAEAHLRFLDALGLGTAGTLDAASILATTTAMLGRTLGATGCAYADMDADQDGFTIRGDWTAPGTRTTVGRHRLADFGEAAVERLRAGLPLVVGDVAAGLPPAVAATLAAHGVAATTIMPLVKEGRLTTLLAVHDAAPRRWRDHELSLIREVTERAWAHVERVGIAAELKASEQNFTILARAMPNHVWTSPPDGQLDWFNERVYAYSGAAPGSLDGAGWGRLVHPDDLPAAGARWAAALADHGTYEAQFRLLRADGVWRWHIARAVPIHGGFGEVVRWIGTNTDIQDQMEVAEALADLNATLERRVAERTQERDRTEEALRQAQKMEAVGQLTGGLAHDFNNLLTGMMGSLELLQSRVARGRYEDVDRFVAAAQGAGRRAAALTQRLLAFSRRQTLDPRPTDVNRLVAGMEDLLRRTVGPATAIEIVGSAGLWTANIDAGQLENALLNLCINGRDAMPDGGRLTIETANKWLDRRAARQVDLDPGQYLSLCVSDTGTGMSPETIERAFEPFYTTKPIGQGTGLGLSMVYGFARQSGGHVRIYSEQGRGTTVCIYLPRHLGAVADDRAVHALPDSAAPGGQTVLVVDDEPTIRHLIDEVLDEKGYTVIGAADGAAGIKVLEAGTRIELLITDVGLPNGMNGRQVADAARALRPGLKVLFITGYAENAAVGNGHLDHGMELLTKPFTMEALVAKVAAMLKKPQPPR